MAKKVLIFGSSEMSELNYTSLDLDSSFEAAAFVVDRAYITSVRLLGLPVVAFEDVEATFPPGEYAFSLLAGFRDVNRFRSERFERIKAKGYELISYVSTSAIVSAQAMLGEGCHVYEGAIVQPFAQIGDDVVVSPAAMVGHHAVVEDHSFISSRATILGSARIGSHCVIAASATVLDGVHVAAHCIIGAGVVVSKDTKEREVYVARPAERLSRPSDQFASLLTWSNDVKRQAPDSGDVS